MKLRQKTSIWLAIFMIAVLVVTTGASLRSASTAGKFVELNSGSLPGTWNRPAAENQGEFDLGGEESELKGVKPLSRTGFADDFLSRPSSPSTTQAP